MKRETLHITLERGRRKRPNRNNNRRRTEQKHNERFREWEQQTAGYCTDERQPQSNTSCHAAAGTETQEALYQQITHSQSVLTQTDTKTQYLLREKADSAKEKQQRACNWTELSQVLHLCCLYATACLSLTVNCCCITQVCSGIYCILCSANSAVMSKIRIQQLQKLPMFKTVIWLIAEAKTPREPCFLLLFILFTSSFVPEKRRLKNVLKSFWRQCHEVTLSLTEHKVIDNTNLWKKMYLTFHRKHGYLYSQIQSTSRVSMSVSEREISASPVSSLITLPVW